MEIAPQPLDTAKNKVKIILARIEFSTVMSLGVAATEAHKENNEIFVSSICVRVW